MLTDYGLTMLNLAYARSLFQVGAREQQTSIRLWAAAFAATGAGAFCGGTFHGLGTNMTETTQSVLWKSTVYSIGLASCCMLAGAIVASVRNPLRRWLLAATGLKFLVYAAWMTRHDDFRYVVYDYAPAMLAILFLQMRVGHTKDQGSRWITAGILASFGAAGIQQSEFALHKHFNHNDLYHVLQMGACHLLYNGTRLLRDQ